MVGIPFSMTCPACYSFLCEIEDNKEGETAYFCQQCGAKLVLADKEDKRSTTQPQE